MPGDCRLDSGACMNGRSCVIIILTLLLTCMIVTRPVAAYPQSDISSWINTYTHVINFGNDSNGYASSMSYANETLVIDHDLEIDQGTSIKMDNVTLVMNGTSNGSLKIEVLDGGSLYLNNSSIITKGPAYNIYIYNDGTFRHERLDDKVDADTRDLIRSPTGSGSTRTTIGSRAIL